MEKKRKMSLSVFETSQISKKAKVSTPPQEIEPFHINSLFKNPAFSHISEKILWFLDHKTQLSCRLVSQSWKAQIDQPRFWIKKCDKEKTHCDLWHYPQPKYIHRAWMELNKKVEKGSSAEEDFTKLLMKWYGANVGFLPLKSEYFSKGCPDTSGLFRELAGLTPSILASRFGHVHILKVFANNEFVNIINAPTPEGLTPITLAAEYGHVEVVKFLASTMINPNEPRPKKNEFSVQWTPLLLAIGGGYIEIVKYFETFLGDPNAYISNGQTLLHLAVSNPNDNIEVVKFLVSKMKDPKVFFPEKPKNDYYASKVGRLPIHVASYNACPKILNFFISTLENPFPLLPNGETLMHMAVEGCTNIERISMNPGIQGWTNLDDKNKRMKVINILLSKMANPNAPRNDGLTPFHVAIKNGNLEMAKYLLTKIDNPFRPFPNGYSPLKVAASLDKIIEHNFKWKFNIPEDVKEQMVKIFIDAKKLKVEFTQSDINEMNVDQLIENFSHVLTREVLVDIVKGKYPFPKKC